MKPLQVDPDGLEALAADCVLRAAAVRAAPAAGDPGPGFQASAAAVTLSHAQVDAASQTLAARIEDMASRLSSAAAAYRTRDGDLATALHRSIGGVNP